ncbi:condensation domain-containing protein [Paenibacillus sp. FSL R7-0210]|uniref:condensation domain-containing protein n=1 Tax=Paenibacillus sp. FSL R7-0210 TaxID=2921676 RepID=UPI0030F595E1
METKKDKIKSLSREQLAGLITKSRDSKKRDIERVARTSNAFSQSFSQQRQWFMEQFMNGGVFNVPQSYRLKGDIRLDILEDVLNAVVEKHESLRTVFNTIDYIPSQIIKPYERFQLDIIHLEESDTSLRAAKIKEMNSEIARRPFDLTVGPLWRFYVLILSEEEIVLTLSLHHIICDGWSFGVIMNEIAGAYRDRLHGQVTRSLLQVQYVDYSEWQRKRIEGGQLDDQLEYWIGKLKDAPKAIHLPYDYRRGSTQTYRGRTEYFFIETEAVKAMSDRCVQMNGSMYHMMMSALTLLMHGYSLDNKLCIGTPVANRNQLELEKLIGLFINTVVIQSEIASSMTFAELFTQVRGHCMEAFNHAEIPFEQVVTGLDIERQMQHSPVFQVLYVQTEESMLSVSIPGIEVEVLPVSVETAQFDLSLYATILKNGISAGFEYNTDLFAQDTILQMIEDFKLLIQLITENPDRTIGEFVSSLSRKKVVMTVVSSFESEPVGEPMEFWLDKFQISYKLQFAPYSQVFQQLIDDTGLLCRSSQGIGILLLRLEDWIQGMDAKDARLEAVLTDNTNRFIQYASSFVNKHQSKVILYLCPASDKVNQVNETKRLIQQSEQKIAVECAKNGNISVLHGDEIAVKYKLSEYNDGLGDEEGHVPYLREYYTAMGTELVMSIFNTALQSTG